MKESQIPISEDGFLEDPGVKHFVDRTLEVEGAVMWAHEQGYYNATHFRYPICYGPRHLAPKEWGIIRRILDERKQLILPNGGLVLLSRGHGKNLAHAMMLAVDNPDSSGGLQYKIRDERILRNCEWVSLIAQEQNHEFEPMVLPLSTVEGHP